MKFYLSQAQREPCALEAADKKDAAAQVRYIAQAELKRARARYSQAHLHRDGDSYLITLGPDRRSSMWTSVALIVER